MYCTTHTHPAATWRLDAARVRSVMTTRSIIEIKGDNGPVFVSAFGATDRPTRRGAPPL
jgi:hypothetical protein